MGTLFEAHTDQRVNDVYSLHNHSSLLLYRCRSQFPSPGNSRRRCADDYATPRLPDAYRNRVRKWYDWGDGLVVDKKWYDWQDVPSSLVAVSSNNNGKREEKNV